MIELDVDSIKFKPFVRNCISKQWIGSQDPENFKYLIEIPKGSKIKYEFKENNLYVDRGLYMPCIQNYGVILNSQIQEDGDFMDMFVISQNALQARSFIEPDQLVLLALIRYEDSGQRDDKLIFGLRSQMKKTSILYYGSQIGNIANYLKFYKTNPENKIKQILLRRNILKSSYVKHLRHSDFEVVQVDFELTE